jgi:hypothetical protein
MAEPYGGETTLPDWHKRLVCDERGARRVDMIVSETQRREP